MTRLFKNLLPAIVMLATCSTTGSAQDIFTPRGFHRNIPQYVDGKVWNINSKDEVLDLRERLRNERKAGDEKKVIATLSAIGAELDLANDFYAAERYHTEALEIAKRICPEKSDILAGAYHNVGVNQEFQKRYADAITSYSNAVNAWTTENPANIEKAAVSNFGLARALEGDRLYPVAIAAYRNALKRATAAGAEALRGEILRDFVDVLEHTHDPDHDKYAQESKEANKKLFPNLIDAKTLPKSGKTSK